MFALQKFSVMYVALLKPHRKVSKWGLYSPGSFCIMAQAFRSSVGGISAGLCLLSCRSPEETTKGDSLHPYILSQLKFQIWFSWCDRGKAILHCQRNIRDNRWVRVMLEVSCDEAFEEREWCDPWEGPSQWGTQAPRLKGRAVTKAEGWHWGRSEGRAQGED